MIDYRLLESTVINSNRIHMVHCPGYMYVCIWGEMGAYESRVSHLNFLLLVLLGTFFYLIDHLLGVIQIIRSVKSETREVIKLTTYRVYRGVYIVLVYIDFSSIPGVQIGVVVVSLSLSHSSVLFGGPLLRYCST